MNSTNSVTLPRLFTCIFLSAVLISGLVTCYHCLPAGIRVITDHAQLLVASAEELITHPAPF